ncbi:unnamed protein product [Prunus brigantina]
MESGTVHNSESSIEKGTRRKWLPFEENSLLTILEDFVTQGLRCDTGSFKSGTLMMEEQSHNEVNPSDIAAENESPMSQGGSHYENSERKRKRGTEN